MKLRAKRKTKINREKEKERKKENERKKIGKKGIEEQRRLLEPAIANLRF